MNEIRKLINIETKINETFIFGAIDTSGAVNCISQFAQGLDYNNRVGDSIKLQRISFSARFSTGTTGTKTFIRTMLVRDLDGYGTLPTVANVLQQVDVLSEKNYLNTERFSVLYDELEAINSVSTPNTVVRVIMPHEGHIKYLGTTAAAASNGKGSLYILTISNETAGTNAPTCEIRTRIYFTDD